MADSAPAYRVLARKYRPQTFADLIGQEAMVRTLANAFKTGRVAHAFMLTGVRGVGKTTTARLIARALNYAREGVEGPSVELDPPGDHCEAIAASRHPDVMEMDAASRTGVGDIREILDGVRYAPVSARCKVYIIDEVHMLSTSAFNALLKTLEEPPDHAKFIFATTEVRKVPVTVLSRCQRFDLKRIEPAVLKAHLQKVAAAEGADVAEDALRLIARAAEGSVRDALSLLDQAIVQGGAVDAAAVADMLGLADRAATLAVLTHALTGDAAGAAEAFLALHREGGDPDTVARDLLALCHDVTRAKMLGEAARFDDAADHVAAVHDLAGHCVMGHLTRVWQMLLKLHEEVRAAPDPAAAMEMGLIRIAWAGGLPSPEDAARMLAGDAPASRDPAAAPPSAAPSAPAPTPEPASHDAPPPSAPTVDRVAPDPVAAPPASDRAPPAAEAAPAAASDDFALDEFANFEPDHPAPPGQIASFADLSALAERHRDLNLKYDIDHYAHPIRVADGTVEFAPTADAPDDLSARIARRLKEWTGARWLVSPDPAGRGQPTLAEQRRAARAALFAAAEQDPLVKAVLETWPGAEVTDVRAAAAAAPDDDDETTPAAPAPARAQTEAAR